MLTLEQIIKKLHDRKLVKVAESIGVDVKTLYRIKNRKTTGKISYDTVKRLSDYLESNEG